MSSAEQLALRFFFNMGNKMPIPVQIPIVNVGYFRLDVLSFVSMRKSHLRDCDCVHLLSGLTHSCFDVGTTDDTKLK